MYLEYRYTVLPLTNTLIILDRVDKEYLSNVKAFIYQGIGSICPKKLISVTFLLLTDAKFALLLRRIILSKDVTWA